MDFEPIEIDKAYLDDDDVTESNQNKITELSILATKFLKM